MAALSAGTYGKATTMNTASFADRITAMLENAHAAIANLDSGVATGAPIDQAAVNTLRKVVTDLTGLATDARQAASDEAAQAAQDNATGQDTAGQGTPAQDAAKTADKGTTKPGSPSTGGTAPKS